MFHFSVMHRIIKCFKPILRVFQCKIFNRIVNAEDNDQGEATHLLLISTCADETLTYDAASDSCY